MLHVHVNRFIDFFQGQSTSKSRSMKRVGQQAEGPIQFSNRAFGFTCSTCPAKRDEFRRLVPVYNSEEQQPNSIFYLQVKVSSLQVELRMWKAKRGAEQHKAKAEFRSFLSAFVPEAAGKKHVEVIRLIEMHTNRDIW